MFDCMLPKACSLKHAALLRLVCNAGELDQELWGACVVPALAQSYVAKIELQAAALAGKLYCSETVLCCGATYQVDMSLHHSCMAVSWPVCLHAHLYAKGLVGAFWALLAASSL